MTGNRTSILSWCARGRWITSYRELCARKWKQEAHTHQPKPWMVPHGEGRIGEWIGRFWKYFCLDFGFKPATAVDCEFIHFWAQILDFARNKSIFASDSGKILTEDLVNKSQRIRGFAHTHGSWILYHIFARKQCILCSELHHKCCLTLLYAGTITHGSIRPLPRSLVSSRGCSLAIKLSLTCWRFLFQIFLNTAVSVVI